MRIDRCLDEVAARFEEQLDELAVKSEARHRAEIEELRDLDAPELWEAQRRITRESRRTQAVRLRNGSLPARCPEPDIQAAQLAANGGLSLGSVLQSYRIGHALTWDTWLDAIDAVELTPSDHTACVRAVSRFLNAYHDRIVELVLAEYEDARNAARVTPELQRLKALKSVLDGSTSDLDGLGYDLDLEHVGVIAWGPDARATLQELASVLDRRLIWAPAEEDLLMAWLGSRSPLDVSGRRALRDFRGTGSSQLAVGGPAAGLEGFRRTHREAGEAHVVARRRPQPLTLHEDVALEAFALRDEIVAREFVLHALEGMGGEDDRSVEYRETLAAYFAAGHNAASAAAALGVHKHTVARRLHAIEEKIGCPVNTRRAELELALRLERILSPPGTA